MCGARMDPGFVPGDPHPPAPRARWKKGPVFGELINYLPFVQEEGGGAASAEARRLVEY